jgi:hypothetical protein
MQGMQVCRKADQEGRSGMCKRVHQVSDWETGSKVEDEKANGWGKGDRRGGTCQGDAATATALHTWIAP